MAAYEHMSDVEYLHMKMGERIDARMKDLNDEIVRLKAERNAINEAWSGGDFQFLAQMGTLPVAWVAELDELETRYGLR
jgi:uncharacterized small protein (DUF1192 family)